MEIFSLEETHIQNVDTVEMVNLEETHTLGIKEGYPRDDTG